MSAARRAERTWGVETSGAETRFRLWAPAQSNVRLRLGDVDHGMARSDEGWFEVTRAALPGSSYAFVLDDGMVVPDPAAHAQVGDVHGASRIVDPMAYDWRCADWAGRPWEEAVILELHVGTFTPEGTFRAAIDKLDALVEAGFTVIELMPVAQYPGNRGWGYDGVLLYAPHPAYGAPDDLKALVDAAHARGLMVLLDVVYNHFGPDGNYLGAYAPEFFDTDRKTPWGPAIAYSRQPVRRFFIENALYWIDEFRLDGLRLDAIDHARDPELPVEVLVEIAEAVRAAYPDGHVHLTTEDNRNVTHLHERGPDGDTPLYSGEWNDDWHNVAHVIATGESEGYYADFAHGHWEKFARALAEGFVFQGEHTAAGDARGCPSGHLPPTAFVNFLQNHDQIGNRAFGERLNTLADPRMVRALTTILLLSPGVPLMFMGEEWGETQPFAFFTDFDGDLADAVREGRRREFRHFHAFEDPAMRAGIPDPNALGTFEASRLDWAGRETTDGRSAIAFTAGLLALRQREIAPLLHGAGGNAGQVVAVEDGAVSIRWRLNGGDLHLRANLSDTSKRLPAPPGRIIHGSDACGEDGEVTPWGIVVSIDAPMAPA